MNQVLADSEKKIFILIPAFNEEKKIHSVISSVQEHGYPNILVVNDGSTDETGEVARKAGAEVLEMLMNRGQGAALSAGLDYLKENYDPDIVVTFDADGQHQAEDIKKIIAPLLENNADVVLGSRFLHPDSKVPATRKMILKAGVLFTNIVSGVNLSDTHNGLRAFGKKALDSIQISQRGMAHASEIIDEIGRKKLNYKEVPVRIVYSDYSRSKGQKSSNFAKLGLQFIINKISK